MDSYSSCPICLELFEKNTNIIHLGCCNNPIHFECLATWINTKKSCPICRNEYNVHEIINIRPSEEYENEPLIHNLDDSYKFPKVVHIFCFVMIASFGFSYFIKKY